MDLKCRKNAIRCIIKNIGYESFNPKYVLRTSVSSVFKTCHQNIGWEIFVCALTTQWNQCEHLKFAATYANGSSPIFTIVFLYGFLNNLFLQLIDMREAQLFSYMRYHVVLCTNTTNIQRKLHMHIKIDESQLVDEIFC